MADSNALRRAALWSWFVSLCPQYKLGEPLGGIQEVSGDASFRRYFRGRTTSGTWVLVDAPPDKEDSRPFLAVQASLFRAGVRVPKVLAADLQQGFMCLEDFGSDLLWPALEQARLRQDTAAAATLYRQAFDELLKIQLCPAQELPPYNEALLQREVLLFQDWLCEGILGLQLGVEDRKLLAAVFAQLVQSALDQPRVYVHRDYHSRNLMLLDAGLGVIDFQDAVHGPFSYDLVSLLKDCYITWPAATVESWALEYLARAVDARIVSGLSEAAFLHSFHLMGAQRHLKAAGIFCRLWLRDGKPGYLQEIPRTLAYISALPVDVGAVGEFRDWLQLKVLPGLEHKLQTALLRPASGASA
jgi:aminoglycoside/choline kinase family phosphotransferase